MSASPNNITHFEVRMFDYIRKLFSFSIIVILLFGGLSNQASAEQNIYPTPEDAANALVEAISLDDEEALRKILGDDYSRLLPIKLIKQDDLKRFTAAWTRSHKLLLEDEETRFLAVGEGSWTLPIPIVKDPGGWRFDTEAGVERIRIRRIGRNELAAMQAVLAYYDAQMEYAEQDRNGNGLLEYAQRLISSPGKHDGLYWQAAAEETQSPLGPLLAEHTPESAYHGYYYRILPGQGAHAKGGVYSYLIDTEMTAGFALIAWPAEYGESGVMSFIVSYAGIIYEANLGPDGETTALAMQEFDPDEQWQPVKEVHGPQTSSED